jgi:murein DD-endopeptidase MepM/ murein hydrolase activator NlpD
MGNHAEVLDLHRRLLDELSRTEQRQERERTEVRAARDEIAERYEALSDRREAQERARATVQLTVLESEELLAEAAVRRSEFERRIAAVAAVSDGIAGTLASLQEGQEPPRISTGIFLPPIRGARVTSPYGPRMHPIYGVARMHNGMDLDGRMGTPIRAADEGVVVFAEDRGGYGLTVVIDHGNTLATLYAHMSSFAVRPGDLVERGDVLGGVGSTGLSTGPHLHWEVRSMGQPVDPAPYLGPED